MALPTDGQGEEPKGNEPTEKEINERLSKVEREQGKGK